jgi:hypothetical protein
MLGVEFLKSDFRSLAINIKKAPPIRQRRQNRSRIFIQTMVISVLHQPRDNYCCKDQPPVLDQSTEEGFDQAAVHVEGTRNGKKIGIVERILK